MKRFAIILAMVIVCNSRALGQDWFAAPFAGATFKADTGFVDLEGATSKSKPVLGASAGRLTDHWLGFEGEIGFVPGFFSGGTGLVSSSRVVTAMGSVVLSPKAFFRDGLVRPYGAIGAGAIFVQLTDVADVFSTSTTLKALNGGGGVIVRLSPRLALRGDMRYLRSEFANPQLGRPALGEQYLHFWRASTGVVIWF